MTLPRRYVPVAALWLAILALALALSVLAGVHTRFWGDLSIAHRIQEAPSPAKTIADGIRTITSTEVVLATGMAIALVLWLRGYRRQAVLLVAGLVAFAVVEVAAKDLVDRPRPDRNLVVRRAAYDSAGSFPSGHVMSATFLYGYLLYLSFRLDITRGARWALGVVAVLILVLSGPVNVYLGVHWPSDVLGAWLWALAVLVPLVAADFYIEERWPDFPPWPRWPD